MQLRQNTWTQSAFTCPKSTMQIQKQCMKHVQSLPKKHQNDVINIILVFWLLTLNWFTYCSGIPRQVFSCEYCEIFKSSFFYGPPVMAASEENYKTKIMSDKISDFLKKYGNFPNKDYHYISIENSKQILKITTSTCCHVTNSVCCRVTFVKCVSEQICDHKTFWTLTTSKLNKKAQQICCQSNRPNLISEASGQKILSKQT